MKRFANSTPTVKIPAKTSTALACSPLSPASTRAQAALDEVARREQVLANQVKAHRECIAQLAEERALLEAERNEHTKKVKLAEEVIARMREELTLDPDRALSDGPNAWPLARMRELLETLKELDATVKRAGFPEGAIAPGLAPPLQP